MRSNPDSPQGGKLLRLAALLLLTPSILVHAQEAESEGELDPTLYNATYFTSSNYGGSRGGPFGISLSDWDSHFDSSPGPNATHTVPLPIPDLTVPYSNRALNNSTVSSYTGSGWNWTIALADNIPVPREANQPPGLTTGVQVYLNAPENIASTTEDGNGMDDSWQLCVIRWHLKEGEGANSSTFSRLRSRDDCNGALSQVCIRDLEAYAASGPDAFGRCRCPDPMTFESCKGEWFPSWSICSQTPYTASEVRDWEDGSLPVFSYAGPPRDEDSGDSLLSYNATGHIVWPVMVVWGRRGGDTSSSLSSTASTTSRTSLATAAATRVGTVTLATRSLSSSSSLSSLTSSTGSTVSLVSTAGSEDNNNNNKRRQSSNNDGSSSNGSSAGGSSSSQAQAQAQAVAKLSCLAVREAEDGSVLPEPPHREENAASRGKVDGVSGHLYLLTAVWGLVVGYMALL